MAADTAYLQGGPCNKQTKKLSVAESDSGSLVCKGGLYLNDNGRKRPNGDIIFKYAGPASSSGGAGGGGSGAYAPNVTRSWSDIQTSVNRRLPTAQHRIDYAMRRTLQRLTHNRRVR